MGCIDYYLDRKEWTEKENDTQSLFSFYLNVSIREKTSDRS